MAAKTFREIATRIISKGLLRKNRKKKGVNKFEGSPAYWEARYRKGENSGAGSYHRLAEFKAEILNAFVKEKGIERVIEFGCGDGNQLELGLYKFYRGFDISIAAVELCQKRFAHDSSKSFKEMKHYRGETAELAMSLDVIYHLIEDDVYENYMVSLFSAAEKYVVIYSSNKDEQPKAKHVRHRRFSDWVESKASDFRLLEYVPNRYPHNETDPQSTSFADFYFYQKIT